MPTSPVIIRVTYIYYIFGIQLPESHISCTHPTRICDAYNICRQEGRSVFELIWYVSIFYDGSSFSLFCFATTTKNRIRISHTLSVLGQQNDMQLFFINEGKELWFFTFCVQMCSLLQQQKKNGSERSEKF